MPFQPEASKLAAMLRATRAACFSWLPDEQYWLATPGVGATLGFPADWQPWTRSDWQQHVHRDDQAAFLPLLDKLALGEAFARCQIRLRANHGGWHRFSCRGECAANGILLVLDDITVKTEIESALHDSQTRLNSLYDTAPVAIILWSREGRITGWNSAAEACFGHSREQVMGAKLVPLLIAPDDYSLFSKTINASIAENSGKEVICRSLAAGGTHLQCRWRSVPLRTRKGALIGIFSLALDVTAEMAAADSLRQAKDSAEQLSGAKSEFMAVVGHELRTPLNGVLGIAQILQTFDLGEEEQGLLSTLLQSGESLLQIVNAIMRYAEADLYAEERLAQPFSLFELLAFGVQPYELQAKAKGLEFELICNTQLAEIRLGDEEGLSGILHGLLENAVRFTDEGSIRVVCSPEVVADGQQWFTVSVIDTGIGMSADFMQNLYTPFKQAENAIVRKHGGVGLGLALVRKLVDRQGAEISVHSQPGQGSTFQVRFKLLLPRGC